MTQQPANIRTCQIIAFSLMMGVMVFGGITLTSHFAKEPLPAADAAENQENTPDQLAETIPVLLLVLFCFTAGGLVARFVVLGAQDRQLENEFTTERDPPLEVQDCMGRYQTRLIISLALLEGPAFFALIVFMQEGRWEAFGLAVFLLFMMGLNFPTETKFHHWVETARLSSGTTIGE